MANLKAYEIRFRNTPGGKVYTVTRFHESAEDAIYEGMKSIRQYEYEAVFVSVCPVEDPRGQVEEAPAPGFWVRDAETGKWEQI